MSIKRNRILIGIILLLVGFLTLWQDFLKISYGRVVYFILLSVSGFAFLLLYRTKRKNWSLILGFYLMYIGIMNFRIGNFSLMPHLFLPMFFIVPALIFFVLYFDKDKRGLLIPASVFFWFGTFIFLNGIGFIKPLGGVLFFACIGLGFMTARVIGRSFLGKWTEILCVSCFAIAVLQVFSLPVFKTLAGFVGGLPKLGAILIIAASVVIIIKALRNKG